MDIERLKAIDSLCELKRGIEILYAKLRHAKVSPRVYSVNELKVYQIKINELAAKRKELYRTYNIKWAEVRRTNGYEYILNKKRK